MKNNSNSSKSNKTYVPDEPIDFRMGGRSVVLKSQDKDHEWRYQNDPSYRESYDNWILGMAR